MGAGDAPAVVRLTAAERAALVDEVATAEERERRAARDRLEPFLRRYLPDAFDVSPGAFHRGIYSDLENLVQLRPIDGAPRDAAAYAYPRSHGKTTTITLGFLSWVIYNWRSMPHFRGKPPFILIVSDTQDQARDRSLDLRDQVESNSGLATDYGPRAPRPAATDTTNRRSGRRRAARWTEVDWTTTDGVRVRAVGAGGKVRGLLRSGRRPTLIVCDDLENDNAVSTELQRHKLENWLRKALIPTGIEGQVLTIVLGTILHADSLLSKLVADDSYPGWLKRRFAALYNEAGLPDGEGTRALWPEGWPVDRLQARKRKIGSLAFAQEYLNQPIDDETALFRLSWLDAARARGRGRGFAYHPPERIPYDDVVGTWDPVELQAGAGAGAYQVVVTAWDLAIVDDEEQARLRDSDYTVGLSLGLTAADRLEVIRVYRRRGLTPAELRSRVLAEQEVIGSDYVVVENNAAQRLLELELRGIPTLPVIGHTTDKRKHHVFEGVPGLALLFELGRIDLNADTDAERRRIDTVCAELHGLGLEAHDDCVMALWIAVCAIRRWQRQRDQRRRRLLGEPPTGYLDTFPEREHDPRRRAAA